MGKRKEPVDELRELDAILRGMPPVEKPERVRPTNFSAYLRDIAFNRMPPSSGEGKASVEFAATMFLMFAAFVDDVLIVDGSAD